MSLTKEFSDSELVDLWVHGLKKEKALLKGFSSFRNPSGSTRINFRLRAGVALGLFVTDPFFTHVKNVMDESVTYSCKILDMNTLPQADIGSTVLVHVKYTHTELTLDQIDDWMAIYGDLKNKSG